MRQIHAIVLLALIAPAARAQQSISESVTFTVRGVVVTANDVPLPRVRVAVVDAPRERATLGATPESERGVLTDDRGQFTIQVPATASLRLAFSKARYTTHTADISPRELTAQGSAIRVRMSLAGAISGQVFDRSGARVTMSVVTLQRVGATDAPTATTTNDLGEFRFGGLVEGAYAISVRPPPFSLGIPAADYAALVSAATVQGPTVKVSFGAETGNISVTIDTPSEAEYAAKRPGDPEATGSLSGRVVNVDGTPIARAVVDASLGFNAGRMVETDERGRYRIDRLGPGDYTVSAWKNGFLSRRYGEDGRTFDRRVAVKNGQAVDSIDVTLGHGGVIAGTIVDEFGEPAQDVAVSPLQLMVTAGHPRWIRAVVQGSLRTDDRGQYRLFGLQPGTYVVQAHVGDTLSAANGYVSLFYPGTPSITQATPTKVDLNAVVTGIDLTLNPSPAHRVTGVVFDSIGKIAPATLTLAASERSGAIPTEPLSANTGPDGSFEFANVAPGDYVVKASGVSKEPNGKVTDNGQFAMSFATVTANDPPLLQLRLTPGATLSGRVRYEGAPADAVLSLIPLPTDRDVAPPLGDGWNSVVPAPDGSFEFQGVFGPTLVILPSWESDWYLKSVVVHGQEQVDSPFDAGTSGTLSGIEVVVSALGATVAGRVTDDRAASVRDYTVVVFSPFRDRWFPLSRWVKTDDPSVDGTFRVRGLPPGDYWIAAIDRRDSAFEPSAEPELLESLSSRASRISLGEGQSQDVTLRLIR